MRLAANCFQFFWRRKWFVIGLIISTTTLIIASQQYYVKSDAISNENEDDFFPEVYAEVLRRWYNFSDQSKWYNDETTSMLDTNLSKEIRDKWIFERPLLGVYSYVLKQPEVRDPSMGQAETILEIFENKKNGFFIECGAYDGETRSNTLVLERFFGWSGLLIEADPINFIKMINKNRKAYLSPTCLSIKPYPMNVSFLMANNIGRIDDPKHLDSSEKPPNTMDVAYHGQHVEVQCFPLISYVNALGIKTVDYFSLDVEGNEMQILETIPFDKVDIKTLSVEYIHGTNSLQYMLDYMTKQGYYVYSFVNHPENLANDVIFVKRNSFS